MLALAARSPPCLPMRVPCPARPRHACHPVHSRGQRDLVPPDVEAEGRQRGHAEAEEPPAEHAADQHHDAKHSGDLVGRGGREHRAGRSGGSDAAAERGSRGEEKRRERGRCRRRRRRGPAAHQHLAPDGDARHEAAVVAEQGQEGPAQGERSHSRHRQPAPRQVHKLRGAPFRTLGLRRSRKEGGGGGGGGRGARGDGGGVKLGG